MFKQSVRIDLSVSKISDSFFGDIFDPFVAKILFSGPPVVAFNNQSRRQK